MVILRIKGKLIVKVFVRNILLGLTLYLLVFDRINLFQLIFLILGSLFPDIDTPYSILGRYNLLAQVLSHRRFTHTVICCVIVSSIICIYEWDIGVSFAFGYMTHLLGDTLTPMGIMWFYPYSKKYYRLLSDNNRYGFEGMIFFLCLVYLFQFKRI